MIRLALGWPMLADLVLLLVFKKKILCVCFAVSDVVGVVEAMYGDDPPPIVLMGHRWVLVLIPAALLIYRMMSFLYACFQYRHSLAMASLHRCSLYCDPLLMTSSSAFDAYNASDIDDIVTCMWYVYVSSIVCCTLCEPSGI